MRGGEAGEGERVEAGDLIVENAENSLMTG